MLTWWLKLLQLDRKLREQKEVFQKSKAYVVSVFPNIF